MLGIGCFGIFDTTKRTQICVFGIFVSRKVFGIGIDNNEVVGRKQGACKKQEPAQPTYKKNN